MHTGLQACVSIEETIRDADVIVMGIPSHSFRQVMEDARPFIRPWVPIVSLTKGREHGSRMRVTKVFESVMP